MSTVKPDKPRVSPYGNGEHPPYALYEDSNGKWGLVDGEGNRLPAVFDRHDDSFSTVPWEVVTFDPQEGFELLAWYDPCEVWFNFTFDDPAYPEEFGDYMWRDPQKDITAYADTLHELIPTEYHRLADAILATGKLNDMEIEDCNREVEAMLKSHPEFADAATTNRIIDPVMRNKEIDPDIPHALWQAKVSFDNMIRG